MPPFYVYVVRDDASENAQDAGGKKESDSAPPPAPSESILPPPAAGHPTGSNAGLIAGSITSIAVVIFLLIVVLVPFIKKRREKNAARAIQAAPATQYLTAGLDYNKNHRRLSLVDRLSVLPPPHHRRSSGEFSPNLEKSPRYSMYGSVPPVAATSPALSPFAKFRNSFRNSFLGSNPKDVTSPELPMQTVPLGSSLPREKFPEDAGEYGFFEEKYDSPKSVPVDETTPLSAYISHHLKTYSANANGNGEFPRSAPVYQTGFNAPQRQHQTRGRHTGDENGYYDEECSSPESAYTQTDGAYTPSTASEYYDHAPPPSAPPMMHYTQQDNRRQSKRMSRSRSPVSELLRRRSNSFHRQSMNLAPNPTIISEPQVSSKKNRPPPLPLDEDEDAEFTINPTEYHHHEEEQVHHAVTPYMLPLPQSALPTGAPGRSAGLSPTYSAGVHSSKSNKANRLSARLRSSRSPSTRSARSPAQIPIPVTPMSGLDHSLDSIVISPTPDHESFSDIPYPRSAR